jgi:hypothetical protein
MESTVSPKPDRRKNLRSTETLPITLSIARGISESEIARRAFELYCARGGQHGRDVDDWLRAERELRERSTAVAAPARTAVMATDSGAKRPARKRAPRKPASRD